MFNGVGGICPVGKEHAEYLKRPHKVLVLEGSFFGVQNLPRMRYWPQLIPGEPRGKKLMGLDLRGDRWSRLNYFGFDFTGTKVDNRTTFTECDFRGAIGVDHLKHHGVVFVGCVFDA